MVLSQASNVALTEAAEAGNDNDAAALRAALPNDVVDAYEAHQADPTNTTLQDAYNTALTAAALTGAQVTTLETAYKDWQNAVAADTLEADAAATAQIDLNAAANKNPSGCYDKGRS